MSYILTQKTIAAVSRLWQEPGFPFQSPKIDNNKNIENFTIFAIQMASVFILYNWRFSSLSIIPIYKYVIHYVGLSFELFPFASCVYAIFLILFRLEVISLRHAGKWMRPHVYGIMYLLKKIWVVRLVISVFTISCRMPDQRISI